MSLLTTSAASLHQVSAAAAFAGPPEISIETGERVVKSSWSKYEAIANVLLTAGWLVEQHTLRTKRPLDPETNGRVAIKDICVAGAMMSNLANLGAEYALRHNFPEGIKVTPEGRPAADAPALGRGLLYGLAALKLINRACVAGAIGFTPLVNFKILESYRPGLLYRLFT